MTTAQARPFLAARLAAAPALAGLPIMLELDPAATADAVAAADKAYEEHMATVGMVIILARPLRSGVAAAASAVIVGALCPVALCENPEVNRRAGGPLRDADAILDAIISAVLCDLVVFPATADLPPVRIDGHVITYAQPIVRCKLKATGLTAPAFPPSV